MPYVAVRQQLLKDDRYMDCDHCKQEYPLEMRRTWKCGWIPRKDWAPKHALDKRMIPGCADEPELCPGYTVRLPDVQTAARAHAWWTKGQLELRFPDASPLLLDLIEIYNGSVVKADVYHHEEALRRQKENQG